MIKIQFTYNREVLSFLIKGKEIYYTDRKWRSWIRCLPPPKDFIKQVRMSRNRIPESLIDIFKFTDEEMAQYEKAKTEEELADHIVFDAKLRGCKLLSRQSE